MGYIHIALSSHEKEMWEKDEKTGGRGREDEEERRGWCEAIRKPV
jgi:hypothetical protein